MTNTVKVTVSVPVSVPVMVMVMVTVTVAVTGYGKGIGKGYGKGNGCLIFDLIRLNNYPIIYQYLQQGVPETRNCSPWLRLADAVLVDQVIVHLLAMMKYTGGRNRYFRRR